MIFVTESPNDRDLIPLLGPLAVPVPIEFGDVNFFGYWTGWDGIRICGERKKLSDMLNSIQSGRHLNQIRMARESGFEFIFLILEAIIRPSREFGVLEERRGNGWISHNVAYSLLDDYLNEIAWYGDIRVFRSTSPRETVQHIKSVYKAFRKPPEDHHMLQKFYVPPTPSVGLTRRPQLVSRMAKELPGVGWGRAKEVEKAFKSPTEMVMASEEEWEKIPGIGKGTVKKVMEALNGGI